MADKVFIEIGATDTGSVIVKKFTDRTVNKVKQMSDRAGGYVKRLTKKFAVGLGGAVKKVGRALISLKTFAIGALAGWGITKVLSKIATFESALADMGKVTSESFGSIKKKIMDLPASLGSATELVKGYYQVISAGVKGAANQLDTLRTASKLAKTAHADQAQVIVGLSSVMDAFKTSSMAAADAIQTMEKTGKTTAGSLIPIIGEISSSSAALGVNLNEMGAAFAAVTLQSGGTEKAATQYKALLVSLLAPSNDLTKLLSQYGGAQEAIKKIGFGGVLSLISDATKGNAAATKNMLGSVEAYLGFLSASANNMATYNANLEEQKNKTGAVDKAWKDYMFTLTAIWDTFKNVVGKQVILIGEKLAPAIKKVVDVTGAWLAKHREFITMKFEGWINGALEGIARFIEGVAGVVEGLYSWKSALHFVLKYLANVGSAAVDTAAAILLITNPLKAAEAAMYGLRETFPTLAEMRDRFDAIGTSQAKAAKGAEESKAKFAGYGDAIKGVADEVRKLVTVEKTAVSSASGMASAHTKAASTIAGAHVKTANTIAALKPKFQIDPVAIPQLEEVKNKAAETADAISAMKPVFSATTKTPTAAGASAGASPLSSSPYRSQSLTMPSALIPFASKAELIKEASNILTSRSLTHPNYAAAIWSEFKKREIAIPEFKFARRTPAVSWKEIPKFHHGTGTKGLPNDGLFYGHKGEIVKNPEESNAERRGRHGDTNHITIAPQFMTGDRSAARNVAAEIQRELDALQARRK